MLDRCNEFLRAHFAQRHAAGRFIALEAGGGSFSYFFMPEHRTLITLDIELGQLLKNRDADFRVQGDLHAIPFTAESVDAVICFNVIEHLSDPEKALAELVRILKPGGLMVIGCPVRNSLKGIITRLTPTSFHRWYYKHVVGKKDRGAGHFDVFATPFKPIVAPRPLRRWCEGQRLGIVFFATYDGAQVYQISAGSLLRRIVAAPYYVVATILRLATLGRWRAGESDLLMVAIK